MKRVFATVVLFLGLVASVQAGNYVEGKHYASISQPTETGDKIEVLEFFWYGCPHCFSFEPSVQKWLKTKPDNVEFVRLPAVFRPSWKVHARTYYALEMMGIIEETHTKIFSAMHNKRMKLDTLESMSGFLERQKVDKKKFLATYNSFTVETKLRKAIKKLKSYNIRGVPAVAVNGKYFITGEKAGSYKNMIEILDFLIKKETAAKGK
jgi:thiol:disulfide interchange protein DsbA